MIFRQWIGQDLGISYLLADPLSRLAVIIAGTGFCLQQMRDTLLKLDLELKRIMLTHGDNALLHHAQNLQHETGARLAAPVQTSAEVDCRLLGNEDYHFGEESLRVIDTATVPASTAGAVQRLAYLWRDRLFIHALFSEHETPSAADTGKREIPTPLLELPEETLIYPARLINKRSVSTLGEEKLRCATTGHSIPFTEEDCIRA